MINNLIWFITGGLVGGFVTWFFTAWFYRVALLRLYGEAKLLIAKDLNQPRVREE